MAERSAVSSKLKLVLSYQTTTAKRGANRYRCATSSSMPTPANVITAVDAIGTLYENPIVTVREVVENEITG